MRHVTVKRCDRPKDSTMGRFGGGWKWNLGVQVGRTTMIVNLVVRQYRVKWKED